MGGCDQKLAWLSLSPKNLKSVVSQEWIDKLNQFLLGDTNSIKLKITLVILRCSWSKLAMEFYVMGI